MTRAQDPLIPVADQTMRGHLANRRAGWAQAAKELEALFERTAPAYPETARRYVTASELVADLGLEAQVKTAAEAGIRDLVAETARGFDFAREMADQGVRQPVIREMLARAGRMRAELRNQRSVQGLYKSEGKQPAGGGWEPIPRGKNGGYRRRKPGGGYEYAYPDGSGDYTTHADPAADEPSHVHAGHDDDTPSGPVGARMAQLEAKAKAAGLTLSGSATKRTTMRQLNELERHLDRAVAQRQRNAKGDKAAPDKGDKDAPDKGDKDAPDKGDKAAPDKGDKDAPDKGDKAAPPAPQDQQKARLRAINDLARDKGVSRSLLRPLLMSTEAETAEGQQRLIQALEELPTVDRAEVAASARRGSAPDDEAPADEAPATASKHADALDHAVQRMEQALHVERQAHAREIAALRREIGVYRRRPTAHAAVQATHSAWSFALLTFGFGAGLLFAGPMGALLGASLANSYLRTGVAKSMPCSPPRLSPGLWVVHGRVLLVKAQNHPSGSGWMTVPGGKKGGYRRPNGSGGFEYWYPDPEHRSASVAAHRAIATDSQARADKLSAAAAARGPDDFRHRVAQTNAATAADQGAIADAAERGSVGAPERRRLGTSGRPENVGAFNEAHRGKRTVGPDEGLVWSTTADLFGAYSTTPDGRIDFGSEQTSETHVTVLDALGETHGVRVELVPTADSYSGMLSTQPRTRGRLRRDTVRVIVPAYAQPREEAAERVRAILAHELAHAMDNLESAAKTRDRAAYESAAPGRGGASRDAYYNDAAEVVAYRHNLFRELNTPEVAAAVTAADGPVSATDVARYLDEHSSTWARVSSHLNPANRRKLLSTAAAVLASHGDNSSTPMAKAMHPTGSGWTTIPEGRHGGYRRPKSGGGYEYWYRDQHERDAAVAHHTEQAAQAREYDLEHEASAHDELAAAARAFDAPKQADVGNLNAAHRGKRTLGPDEGQVWSVTADLLSPYYVPDGEEDDDADDASAEGAGGAGPTINLAQRFGPPVDSTVTVRGVHGTHEVVVRLRTVQYADSDEFSGVAQTRRDEAGRLVPESVTIFVPALRLPVDQVATRVRSILAHELAHSMDAVSEPDKAYANDDATYYNNAAEVVAYRHNLFRELNTPEVAAAVTAADGPVSATDVASYLQRYSSTWARVSPHLNPTNRRKLLSTAAAVLASHGDNSSTPMAKAVAEVPAPPPRIRGRHATNVHGHTDGLLPGQQLTVRKGVAGPQHVTVLEGGAFAWGEERYPNARQLLKALTGQERHRQTLRRYFALGPDHQRLAKAMAETLRAIHPDLLISAYQGKVRAEGDLAKAGLGAAGDTAVVLDLEDVQALLAQGGH